MNQEENRYSVFRGFWVEFPAPPCLTYAAPSDYLVGIVGHLMPVSGEFAGLHTSTHQSLAVQAMISLSPDRDVPISERDRSNTNAGSSILSVSERLATPKCCHMVKSAGGSLACWLLERPGLSAVRGSLLYCMYNVPYSNWLLFYFLFLQRWWNFRFLF